MEFFLREYNVGSISLKRGNPAEERKACRNSQKLRTSWKTRIFGMGFSNCSPLPWLLMRLHFVSSLLATLSYEVVKTLMIKYKFYSIYLFQKPTLWLFVIVTFLSLWLFELLLCSLCGAYSPQKEYKKSNIHYIVTLFSAPQTGNKLTQYICVIFGYLYQSTKLEVMRSYRWKMLPRSKILQLSSQSERAYWVSNKTCIFQGGKIQSSF